ncbi:hypothetical protein OHA77_40630 [Streptosporangium sp. NBC_01639]|uniref:hypothetical protein n=1 Tax=unclassified Streptosporangium TaxID=2632669 RepID=UPI002DDB8301|nr:hypothetical protein [Streptosporangium sp. NBC_01756]WSC86553.1 hypothetical protein OIE48_40465 [Streptosporangium sp. NBC_01756]WTD54830.1 hypothetical protein OHA77_40630 [Streptosporangium sp. NBC_01639]
MKQATGLRIGRAALMTATAGGVAVAGVVPAANAASAAQRVMIGPFGYGSLKLQRAMS